MRLRLQPPIAVKLGVLALFALFVSLWFVAATGTSDGADAAIIAVLQGPALAARMRPLASITGMGSTEAVAIVALATAVLAARAGKARTAITAAGTVAGAIVTSAILKAVVARSRPDLLDPLSAANGFSFPSGHAMLSAAAYGILGVFVAESSLKRGAKGLLVGGLVALVFLIGVSRIYLGVHYPTDVLAGWVAGSLFVLAFAGRRDRPSTDASAQ